MSTRGQVMIQQDRGHDAVYLYQHYDGYELPKIVQDALKRGKDRWNDSCYLARIIFCEMVKDDLMGTRVYGIDTQKHGDIDVLVEVMEDMSIKIGEKKWSFTEYIELSENEIEMIR